MVACSSPLKRMDKDRTPTASVSIWGNNRHSECQNCSNF